MPRNWGTRKLGGRYFILAGRGTREAMEREAVGARKRWRYVRIVPAGPMIRGELGRLLDDWMLYVFEQKGGVE